MASYLWWSLILALLQFVLCQDHPEEIEFIPQDGWYNNPVHIDWGAIDGQLLRRSTPAYADGVYHMSGPSRPNPFTISQIAHSGEPGLGSARGRNAMMVYFGQQVVEEVLDSQRPGCPREFENIPVPKNHPLNPGGLDNLAMPFLRTRYDASTGYSPNNPRQQLNEITPFLDGTLFYGPAKAWTDAIREFKDGKLKASNPDAPIEDSFPFINDIRLPFANPPAPRQHILRPVSRFLRIGNPRGNENPMLLTFAILFFRWHNRIAERLKADNPTWDDEELFEEARKYVIAHHQKIVMYDWLPPWLELTSDGNVFPIPPYERAPNTSCDTKYCGFNGYSSEIHPGITQEFQTAAMRFGHTLVTPGLWLRGPSENGQCNWKSVSVNIPGQPGEVHALRLCNAYWNSQETVEPQLEDLVRGMTSTLAEKEDHIMVPDLRDHVFGPLDFSRRDLGAINIQRGRDHGLTGYNKIREAYGLEPKATWRDINPALERNLGVLSRLQALYGNTTAPDELDIFSGGLLETTEDGPGELFREILLEQFLRIRHGDRFWFEITDSRFRRFSDYEIAEIHKITLRDIILNVTRISPSDISADVFIHKNTSDPCPQPQQLAADARRVLNGTVVLENCTVVQHYDYFYGSEASFALTFVCLGLCVPATIGIMLLMVKLRQKKIDEARRKMTPRQKHKTEDPDTFSAVEWVGPNMGERRVKIKFDRDRKKLHVTDTRKKPLRMLDLRRLTAKIHIRYSRDKERNLLSIRVPNEIDLVLRFLDEEERDGFTHQIEPFLRDLGINRETHDFDEKSVLDMAETKEERQKVLDTFFRVICVQAFDRSPGQMNLSNLTADEINKVQGIQLTRTEFAEALGLKPTSVFVRNMFLLVDTDNSGTVNFQEFLDMFVVMSSGNADDKAMLMFNMYDIRKRGYLTRNEFVKMIESLLDLSDSTIDKGEIDNLIQTMYQTAGIAENRNIDLNDFKRIFASDEHKKTLENAALGVGTLEAGKGKGGKRFQHRKTLLQSYRTTGLSRTKSMVKVQTKQKEVPPTAAKQKLNEVIRYIENYKRQIFWCTLYTLVLMGIFVERAYYYSIEREHAGLRRIAGYGVTITRGAASAMMFTFSSLLVTMSRNTITFLRETFFHTFIPFDSAHAFHKLIAIYALVFTVVHCVGHGMNLYHISTQASTDLNCVFREYFRATDILASFHYWAFTTITGLTGVILTLIVIIMYVFAIPFARRNLFNAFWFTHNFYILLYIFMVLHGSGRLVQDPLFQNFFYGPMVIYVLDKLVSVSRKKRETSVIQADLLPSDVTALKFKRPLDFDYKSGQWVRIACLDLGEDEYHPFTLTSAPHEDFLSLHIRAVGPWTMNLRSTYDPNNLGDNPPPKVYVDGPFGEGHQDWYKYPVAVLVGGGIGVTPFASILKDIVHRSQQSNQRMTCQKVYFLWVTRTQKQFEWLTDIIRDVENADRQELVSVHIFITQLQQKFDLRTTMLYICERHFHKVAGKSLFTGLSSTTHFGRPQFQEFLLSLHHEHKSVKQIGVFSCGPPPMTLKVDQACSELNKNINLPTYSHHFENF